LNLIPSIHSPIFFVKSLLLTNKKRSLKNWKKALEILENEENESLKGKIELAKVIFERKFKKLDKIKI